MPRHRPIAFRVTDGEHSVISAAATAAGLSLRQFLVAMAVEYLKACAEAEPEDSAIRRMYLGILDRWQAEKTATSEGVM